jgi:hypothetical protein
MPENTLRHTFKVVIDDFALPKELVERINKALQKAVLAEMASTDLRGNDVVFTPIMGQMLSEDAAKALSEPNGRTGGIWVRPSKEG